MSVTYEILKRLVKAANIKKRWIGMSTEELLDSRRRANAKNRIHARLSGHLRGRRAVSPAHDPFLRRTCENEDREDRVRRMTL